jgi:hypothetical protein
MADDVTLNSMSGGAVVATDDSGTGHVQIVKLAYSADGDRTHIPATAAGLAVIERGSTIGHSSASVTTTVGSILSSASTRRTITVQNLGTDYVWLGATGVAVGSGLRLAPGQTAVIDRSPNAQLFAIASSGTQSVSIFTESD